MRALTITAVLALCAALPAQAASYTYIDQKAPYSNRNPPMLTALNLPKIGTTFKIQVPASNIPFTPSYLGLGLNSPNVPIPALCGYLFTSADVVMLTPLAPTPGMTTMSFPIPNSPQLVGVRFYQQVFQVFYCPWSHCPAGYSLSRGGYGVIGK